MDKKSVILYNAVLSQNSQSFISKLPKNKYIGNYTISGVIWLTTEAEMRLHQCCFTGHRPSKLPWGEDERDPRCLALKRELKRKLEEANVELLTSEE